MPKSGFDEVVVRRSFCRFYFDRSRESVQFRANFCAHAARRCDSSSRGSKRATSGADEEDRRAECEDRHALAANSQASTAAVQSTSRRHDWRRLSFNINFDNIHIYSGGGRILHENWRWQQPHRRPRGNADLDRENAQHQRQRAAKIQSHRQSFEIAGRADAPDSPIANSIAVIRRIIRSLRSTAARPAKRPALPPDSMSHR
jgi:hypothetical protein